MADLPQPDAQRLGKIVALANSPVEGEAAAAIAKLQEFVRNRPYVFAEAKPTLASEKIRYPLRGSREYCKIFNEWRSKYEFLSVNRHQKCLTHAEVREIKNLVRYYGLPRTLADAARLNRLVARVKKESSNAES